MEIQYVINSLGVGHNKAKTSQKLMWICKPREVSYGVEIPLKHLYNKGLHK
jgi:hypothetical protein